MSEIKDKLKDLITDGMIPEVEAYLEELHELLEISNKRNGIIFSRITKCISSN